MISSGNFIDIEHTKPNSFQVRPERGITADMISIRMADGNKTKI
jgi:hypothetical protein